MRWYHYISYLCGGAFLANAIPHLVSGITGHPFQSPFASPLGQGLRDLLVLFPEHVAARGLVLPRHASAENLDYQAIRDALMLGEIPEDMDGILYLPAAWPDLS